MAWGYVIGMNNGHDRKKTSTEDAVYEELIPYDKHCGRLMAMGKRPQVE
jgi:hypothetical protein